MCFPRGFQALCSHWCDRNRTQLLFLLLAQPEEKRSRLCWIPRPPSQPPAFSTWSDLRGTSLEVLLSCFPSSWQGLELGWATMSGENSQLCSPAHTAWSRGSIPVAVPQSRNLFPFKGICFQICQSCFKAQTGGSKTQNTGQSFYPI